MDKNLILQNITNVAVRVGFMVVAALAIWIVGRWLIGFVVRLVSKALTKRLVEPTIVTYVGSIVTVMLNIFLVVAILGVFGVETTTIAALVAGAGVAIGLAWSGLLANFAAGAFLVILRPFKVGDFIAAGGVTGTVQEMGLFVTTINTMDNVRTFVGNNKLFADNIQNFTVNPFRRVDLEAQLDHSVDVHQAIDVLRTALEKIPNVVEAPKPDLEILKFSPLGPVLAVRPYCSNDHYWQVYFDSNRVIRDAFGAAGFPAPETHISLRNGAGAQSVMSAGAM
ncbi:MAG TPA: mechanosensitive ion channel family protein [Pyrinomonadaceae bacterium]|nr:mechanosensitive ion channel family protein [Pyrinomonadaceae bacterium]